MPRPEYEVNIEVTRGSLMRDLPTNKRRGILLRSLRVREGLSQQQFADECTALGNSIKPATLHRIEDGSRTITPVIKRGAVLDCVVQCLESSPRYSAEDVSMLMTQGEAVFDEITIEPPLKDSDGVLPIPIFYTRPYAEGEITTLFVGDTGVEFAFGLPEGADAYDRVAMREQLQHGIAQSIRGFLKGNHSKIESQ